MSTSSPVATRGLVIANLGTPTAPTAEAVHAYLREFLTDKRVVQIPHLLWKPLLDWVILPRRSPVVAEKYAEIWMGDEGSPLLAYTLRLARAMQAALPSWRVLPAMRYGQPALADAITQLHREGIRDITVLPLYPQYSTTTTASMAVSYTHLDVYKRQMLRRRLAPKISSTMTSRMRSSRQPIMTGIPAIREMCEG